jgi:hypothetical protein
VVKYHELARPHLRPPRFLMRPLLNGGTSGRQVQPIQLVSGGFYITRFLEKPAGLDEMLPDRLLTLIPA